MRAVLLAAVLVSGLAPAAVTQPSPADDWRPLVGMCEAYAKANPPPHANGPVSKDYRSTRRASCGITSRRQTPSRSAAASPRLYIRSSRMAHPPGHSIGDQLSRIARKRGTAWLEIRAGLSPWPWPAASSARLPRSRKASCRSRAPATMKSTRNCTVRAAQALGRRRSIASRNAPSAADLTRPSYTRANKQFGIGASPPGPGRDRRPDL